MSHETIDRSSTDIDTHTTMLRLLGFTLGIAKEKPTTDARMICECSRVFHVRNSLRQNANYKSVKCKLN